MGAWGIGPAENDVAADWLTTVHGATGLTERVTAALHPDAGSEPEELRVAASMVLALCERGLWPMDLREESLNAAIAALEQLLASGDAEDIAAAVEDELSALQECRGD